MAATAQAQAEATKAAQRAGVEHTSSAVTNTENARALISDAIADLCEPHHTL